MDAPGRDCGRIGRQRNLRLARGDISDCCELDRILESPIAHGGNVAPVNYSHFIYPNAHGRQNLHGSLFRKEKGKQGDLKPSLVAVLCVFDMAASRVHFLVAM